MVSNPIISWQVDGENMETVRNFIFLGSKITADGYCSHEIKRHLLLGRKAETPILWPLDPKSQLIRKDPDAGKDCRQEEKGMTAHGMVGWHRWLNGHEFEQALGDGEGQRSLACCSPWGHSESDMTEWLNINNLLVKYSILRVLKLTGTYL